MQIKFQRLRDDAVLPSRNHNAAGYDLHVCEIERMSSESAGKVLETNMEGRIIRPDMVCRAHTGIAFEPPAGYFGLIDARSGFAAKYGLNNPCGTIDEDYRGEIMVVFTVTYPIIIQKGDRIAHLILLAYPDDVEIVEVDNLQATERGDKGFGSSGN